MATVFISYSHEDTIRVRQLALALTELGHGVWWDRKLLAGQNWASLLQERIEKADAVVVVWSSHSVNSEFVLDEASRSKGKLVPVALDGAQPPLGFGRLHTIDLSAWLGAADTRLIAELSEAIDEMSSATPASEPKKTGKGLKFFGIVIGGSFYGIAVGALAAGLVGTGAYLIAHDTAVREWWSPSPRLTTTPSPIDSAATEPPQRSSPSPSPSPSPEPAPPAPASSPQAPRPPDAPADDLIADAARFLESGRFEESAMLLARVISTSPPASRDAVRLAGLLNTVARVHYQHGRYREAERLLQPAVATLQEALGSEHPLLVMSLNNLSQVYVAEARYAEAEPLLQRSVAILERTLGPDRLEVAASLSNLAQVYALQGRLAEATQVSSRSRSILEASATAGNAMAMNEIGQIYAHGMGSPLDYAQAREWFERAAAAGSAEAMVSLAGLHANGLGTPLDYVRAREWLERAAAAGSAEAMRGLGELYARGQGVPKDRVLSREWFERAAAAGDLFALARLAWHELLAQEPQRALQVVERALQRDPDSADLRAMRALALMFLGQAELARATFLSLKATSDRHLQRIAADFDALQKAGLDHPQMRDIAAELGIAAPAQSTVPSKPSSP